MDDGVEVGCACGHRVVVLLGEVQRVVMGGLV